MTGNGAAAITAIGMTTPVGFTAAQSCAAVRASISAIAELEYFPVENDSFEEIPVAGCAIRGYTDGYLGLGRWTRLATAALEDLLASAGLSGADLETVRLYLALPSPSRRGTDERLSQLLGLRIGQWINLPGIEARTRVYADGHATAAQAFREALGEIAHGAARRVVICGVDSLVEPDTLEFFHEKRRLKTEDNVDGLFPGEAAAAVLVERAEDAKARGGDVLAAVEAPGIATEPVTIWSDEPCQGIGLAEAIRVTLGQLTDGGAETGLLVCDLNGESYRAREFGVAATRALSALRQDWQLWHPADCIGDTGAASFTISTALAAKALYAGYAKTAGALVWGSSDEGLRGSVYLRQSE